MFASEKKCLEKLNENFIELVAKKKKTRRLSDSVGFENHRDCRKPSSAKICIFLATEEGIVDGYARWYASLEARSCVATIKREQKFSPSVFESATVTGNFQEVDCCIAGNVHAARYFPPIAPISSVYLNKFYRSSIVLITLMVLITSLYASI